MSPLGVLFRFDGLAVEQMIVIGGAITLVVAATADSAACPRCQVASTRVHSRYWRILHDLPGADIAVTLRLHVRRFRCTNPPCPRGVFAERFTKLTQVHARRTDRQAEAFPERAVTPKLATILNPYEPYLRERWAAGIHNAYALWREIRERGFTGSASLVRRFLAAWRDGPGRSGRTPKRASPGSSSPTRPRLQPTTVRSPRQARRRS